MRSLLLPALLGTALFSPALPALAQPFTATPVAEFDSPWAIAMLPDGRMLVTEKPGRLFLVTEAGETQQVAGVPEVWFHGQTGLLDIAPAPDFADSARVYLTYVAPGDGGALTLARAELATGAEAPALEGLEVLWQQAPGGDGHPGGIIAFDPAGEHLFLSVGERTESATAQDPDAGRGKILRFTLDGGVPADNPQAQAGGVRALTWTDGHRNPYGLAFAPDGRLWEHEMGPRGGDELNLIEAGQNYGWPVVSDGSNYNGSPIPDHETSPSFAAPVLTWTPVIAPAGLAFYSGAMFPDWEGLALIGGLASEALVAVRIDGDSATEVDRWDMRARIRDVAVAADGAVWVIEDDPAGRLIRLTAE